VLLLDKASESLGRTEEGVLDKILNLISNHIRLYKVSCSRFREKYGEIDTLMPI
jgi:hypothetical protein